MKVLFACGGTAGHINPALAVAAVLRQENRDTGILFVGNPERMEARLVPEAGYDFAPIRVEGFQRKLTPANIKRNASAIYRLITAPGRVREILDAFRPDVVVGTGGYVSGPVLHEAAKLGYPTLTHESNAYPGVTTKLLAREVDVVLLAVEQAKEHLPKNGKYIITGNPVRPELTRANRDDARRKLGVGGRICIVSLGGSLGAERINEAMAETIAHFFTEGRLHHIHATGSYGVDSFPVSLRRHGLCPLGKEHLDIREYISDMADCMAAADLVICRAGAITLSELQTVGRASILIPSPNVSENHQYHNAMVLAEKNAAVVIEEKDLTGKLLCDTVKELIDDPQELVNMGRNAASMARLDAAKHISAEINVLYARAIPK